MNDSSKDRIASDGENYSEVDSQKRFDAALKGALKTPHKPLKENPVTKKKGEPKKKPGK